jgi:hypothetical protein
LKVLEEKREKVPVLDENSKFGDAFEFWNISGRMANLDEVIKAVKKVCK